MSLEPNRAQTGATAGASAGSLSLTAGGRKHSSAGSAGFAQLMSSLSADELSASQAQTDDASNQPLALISQALDASESDFLQDAHSLLQALDAQRAQAAEGLDAAQAASPAELAELAQRMLKALSAHGATPVSATGSNGPLSLVNHAQNALESDFFQDAHSLLQTLGAQRTQAGEGLDAAQAASQAELAELAELAQRMLAVLGQAGAVTTGPTAQSVAAEAAWPAGLTAALGSESATVPAGSALRRGVGAAAAGVRAGATDVAGVSLPAMMADAGRADGVRPAVEPAPGGTPQPKGAPSQLASAAAQGLQRELQAPLLATATGTAATLAAWAAQTEAPARGLEAAAPRPQVQRSTGSELAIGSAWTERLGLAPTYEVAETAAAVPLDQVAETVSYWVTQGIQSAELTLEGWDGEAVEVRIALEGKQAQVDFRTDQAEVRQALESASAQLKAMLSGEGLQLAGLSVGTSARGGAQDAPRQGRQPARQALVESAEAVSTRPARSLNPAVGQALDLFV